MSILDSFLLALITALQRPEDSELDAQSPGQSKDEVLDWDAVMAFLRAIADGAEYATSSLGRLYFNAILARRTCFCRLLPFPPVPDPPSGPCL